MRNGAPAVEGPPAGWVLRQPHAAAADTEGGYDNRSAAADVCRKLFDEEGFALID